MCALASQSIQLFCDQHLLAFEFREALFVSADDRGIVGFDQPIEEPFDGAFGFLKVGF
ncbi:MAG: hypothetical protein AAF830_14000 [Pseudomonadota bacterium]